MEESELDMFEQAQIIGIKKIVEELDKDDAFSSLSLFEKFDVAVKIKQMHRQWIFDQRIFHYLNNDKK
jgi:hypothetical protein